MRLDGVTNLQKGSKSLLTFVVFSGILNGRL
jgi:hypothetical protein